MVGLTEEQEKAVAFDKGTAVVVAVAGSGKTQMLLARTKHLLTEKKIDPERILVLMFNTSAAVGFNERLEKEGIDNFAAGTFHAFGKMLLEAYINAETADGADWKPISLLETEDEYMRYIGKVMAAYARKNKDPKTALMNNQTTRHRLMEFIEALKNSGFNDPSEADRFILSRYADGARNIEPFSSFFTFFENERKKEEVYAFTDLLHRLNFLLDTDDEFRTQMQGWYDYVMVDEYQDSNTLQHQIIKKLSPPSLMLVGDEDQSIYAFRGAKPEYMTHGVFTDYENAEVLRLTRTFRYGHTVSMMANALIGNNIDRFDKMCISDPSAPQTKVHIVRVGKDNGLSFIGKNLDRLNGFKILLRTNEEVDAVNMLLWDKGVTPVNAATEDGMWSNSPKTAFVYDICSMAATKNERLSNAAMLFLMRCAGNGNFVSVATDDINSMLDTAAEASALTAIANLGRTTRYTDAKNALRNMYRYLNRVREMEADRQTVGDLLQELGKTFVGLHAGPLLHNIYIRFKDTVIAEFYQKLNRRPSECNIEVMTVHAAKGATFDKVLIPNLTEKGFPLSFDHHISISDLEEERRLFYVALTRCSEELIMSFPDQPVWMEALKNNDRETASAFWDTTGSPSRFVFECEPLYAVYAANKLYHGSSAAEPYQSEKGSLYFEILEDEGIMPSTFTGRQEKTDKPVLEVWDSKIQTPVPSPLEVEKKHTETGGEEQQKLDEMAEKMGQIYRSRIQAIRKHTGDTVEVDVEDLYGYGI